MLDYQAHPCYFAKFSFFAHVDAVASAELHQKEVFWTWGFLISAIYIILVSGNASLFLGRVRQKKNSLPGFVETRGDDLLCADCVSEAQS